MQEEGVDIVTDRETKEKRRGIVAHLAILALGIAFVIVGLVSGDAAVVFKKAAVICLECIGIG